MSPANSNSYYSNGNGNINASYIGSPTEDVSQPHPQRVLSRNGNTNPAYQVGSTDDLGQPPVITRSTNGHSNRAYIPSTTSFDDPFYSPTNNNSSPRTVYTIPTKDGIGHDPNRYDTTDNLDSKDDSEVSKCCCSRIVCCVFITITILAIVGTGVFVGLYFGKSMFFDSISAITGCQSFAALKYV